MVEVDAREALSPVVISATSSLIVIGIPAFNEEKTIARVVFEAQKHADVVIVCDDGSTDLTGVIAERFGAIVVRHEGNLGYGAALQSLFDRARELRADILVTLDSDGQHNPAEIPVLIKPIEAGLADVVVGSRFKDKSGTAEMPLYRQLGVRVITKLANGSGKSEVSDAQSGFRAYSRHALENLSMTETGMSASVELLRVVDQCGLKVCEVPITCKYADSIGTKTSTEHPITHGIGLIVYLFKLVVEERPLPLLGIPGMFSLAIGILFGVWMMDLYAASHMITTNIALASIAFILIGFFMLSTAVTLYAIARISQKINLKKQ